MSSSKYFEDLDIDPYEMVGVPRKCDKKILKKAYLEKALYLHPDKTNGKTAVEFKLLTESYNYIKNCLDGKIRDAVSTPDFHATDYKSNFKDDNEYNYTRNNANYNTQRELFVDHGLPRNVDDNDDNLDRIFGQRKKTPKEYNPNLYVREQVNIFGGEGYDQHKFNAMFELHKEKHGCNQAYEETETG
jgi:DnaJ-class molecular chaperone